MKIVIITCIVIVISYLIYCFRYYLSYFFSLIYVSFKNRKSIKDIQKQGVNKRKVSNSDIQKYITYAKQNLADIGFIDLKDFEVDKELERHLKYSRFSEKYMEELLCKILEHMKLKREELDFEVEYMSSKKSYGYVGLYCEKENNPKAKIYIYIKNDMTYETVISTLAHECSHHLLLSRGVRLENKIENECLTDVVTILMGFGRYMIKGYEVSNRVIYEEEFLRLVDKDRVGYLSSKDVRYALKRIRK